MRGKVSDALAEAERALAMSPNLPDAHGMLGIALILSGRPKEGLAALETSIRLNPRGRSAHRANYMAMGEYFAREYDGAVGAARRAIRAYPDYPHPYRWLAAALGQLGHIEEATPVSTPEGTCIGGPE